MFSEMGFGLPSAGDNQGPDLANDPTIDEMIAKQRAQLSEETHPIGDIKGKGRTNTILAGMVTDLMKEAARISGHEYVAPEKQAMPRLHISDRTLPLLKKLRPNLASTAKPRGAIAPHLQTASIPQDEADELVKLLLRNDSNLVATQSSLKQVPRSRGPAGTAAYQSYDPQIDVWDARYPIFPQEYADRLGQYRRLGKWDDAGKEVTASADLTAVADPKEVANLFNQAKSQLRKQVKIEVTRGRRRYPHEEPRQMSYGEISGLLNPDDGDAWDVFLAPSSKASDKKRLQVVGWIPQKGNKNYKLILAKDGKLTPLDKTIIAGVASRLDNYGKPVMLAAKNNIDIKPKPWKPNASEKAEQAKAKRKAKNLLKSAFRGVCKTADEGKKIKLELELEIPVEVASGPVKADIKTEPEELSPKEEDKKLDDLVDKMFDTEGPAGKTEERLHELDKHGSLFKQALDKLKGKHTDKLKGGLADDKKPSDFPAKAMDDGLHVELEHTDSRQLATEITMDHLTEDPKYYEKLEKMEAKTGSLFKLALGGAGKLVRKGLQEVTEGTGKKLKSLAESGGDEARASLSEMWDMQRHIDEAASPLDKLKTWAHDVTPADLADRMRSQGVPSHEDLTKLRGMAGKYEPVPSLTSLQADYYEMLRELESKRGPTDYIRRGLRKLLSEPESAWAANIKEGSLRLSLAQTQLLLSMALNKQAERMENPLDELSNSLQDMTSRAPSHPTSIKNPGGAAGSIPRRHDLEKERYPSNQERFAVKAAQT
jgi:hypothetical protein